MIQTRIRFDVKLSGNHNVFTVSIFPQYNHSYNYSYHDSAYINLKEYGNKFEIIFHGNITGFSVIFEEHQEDRRYTFNVSSSQLGGKYGIIFIEQPNPHDYYSYAGRGISFLHPLFQHSYVDYCFIDPDKSIDIEYMA